MTLVMAWRESDLPRVWIVSDSRLSMRGAVGRVQLTDRGAKLLSAELVLRRQTPLSVLGTPVARRSLGFAYAGSSLIALQSYAAILPLWSHLQTVGEEVLPSVESCAAHLGMFVAAYAREISAAQGAFQSCECALIGFDDGIGDVDGWSVCAEVDGEICVKLRRLNLSSGNAELFGSGSEVARARLAAWPIKPDQSWRREPLDLIRGQLRGEIGGDVGGGVQLGFVSRDGFELLFDAQPYELGNPLAWMRFRGFDFSEISRVGEAFVNLPGMS